MLSNILKVLYITIFNKGNSSLILDGMLPLMAPVISNGALYYNGPVFRKIGALCS